MTSGRASIAKASDDRAQQALLANYIKVASLVAGVSLEQECEPGVRLNLILFLQHARIVAEADRAAIDPAEFLRP